MDDGDCLVTDADMLRWPLRRAFLGRAANEAATEGNPAFPAEIGTKKAMTFSNVTPSMQM